MDTDTLILVGSVGDDLVAKLSARCLMSVHVLAGLDGRDTVAEIDRACRHAVQCLADDLDALHVLKASDNDSREDVAGMEHGLVELKLVIAAVRRIDTYIYRHVRSARVRADGADADRILGGEDADTLGTERDGLVAQEELCQALLAVFDLVQHLESPVLLLDGNIPSGSAVGDHAVVDTVAGQVLEDIHDRFTVIPGMHEQAVMTDDVQRDAQPQIMGMQSLQLCGDDTHVLALLRNLNAGDSFQCHRVGHGM